MNKWFYTKHDKKYFVYEWMNESFYLKTRCLKNGKILIIESPLFHDIISYLLVVNGEFAGCVLSLSEVFDFSLSWATWYRKQKFKKLFKLNGTNTWKLGPGGKVSNNKVIRETTLQGVQEKVFL